GRWRFLRGSEDRSVQIVPKVAANSGEALRQAALAGCGVLLQPEVLVEDDIARRRLVRLLPAWSVRERPMHLVYVGDRPATPKLRGFVEFRVERFGLARK